MSQNTKPDETEFDRWQQRFAAPGYLFGTAPNAFLQAQAHLLRPGQSALAIADGEGRNGVFLAEQGLDVLSVDFSPVGQAKARALAKARGVTLRAACVDDVGVSAPSSLRNSPSPRQTGMALRWTSA